MGITRAIEEHQDLSFKQTSRENPNYILRDKRHQADKDNIYLLINEKKYGVLNYSPNGIAIEGDEILLQQELLSDVSLYIHGYHVRTLTLKLIRSRQDSDSLMIAYKVTGKSLNFPQIDAAYHASSLINAHKKYVHSADDISPKLKAEVYEIKNWLEHLQWEINQEEISLSLSGNKSALEYEKTFIPIVVNYLSEIIPSLYERIEVIIETLEGAARDKAMAFVLLNLNPIFHQAPFAERAYSKPLGYAGDYEMMNLIYRNEDLGKSLFARCLHRFCIDTPAAQAVRNRANFLIDTILSHYHSLDQDTFNVLSVACGPAREWQYLIPQMQNTRIHTRLDLLDQDTNALNFTRNELGSVNQLNSQPIDINYINMAIKNIITRGLENDDYQLIYSAGLFDYFSDAVAISAAKTLYRHLAPGGRLIIGNFNVGQDSKNIMDYIFNWPLIYRTADELKQMFGQIGNKVSIESEELGINLFCIIEK